MSTGTSGKERVQELDVEARDRALARIRKMGRPVTSVEQLYGPDSEADDPEDLEAFLAYREEQRRPVSLPRESEES